MAVHNYFAIAPIWQRRYRGNLEYELRRCSNFFLAGLRFTINMKISAQLRRREVEGIILCFFLILNTKTK